MQWSVSIVVVNAHICIVIQEKTRNVRISTLQCCEKWGRSIIIPGVDLRIALK